MLDIAESFQLQIEEAAVYARKDSASFTRIAEKFNRLRMQWFRDLRTTRGQSGASSAETGYSAASPASTQGGNQ
jgi:hypothetical protein